MVGLQDAAQPLPLRLAVGQTVLLVELVLGELPVALEEAGLGLDPALAGTVTPTVNRERGEGVAGHICNKTNLYVGLKARDNFCDYFFESSKYLFDTSN